MDNVALKRFQKRHENERAAQTVEQAWYAGLLWDHQSARSLQGWLSRLMIGNTEILRSGSTKSVTFEDAIAQCDVLMKRIKPTIPDARLRDAFMDELELSNRKNIGPKSQYRPYPEDGPDKLAAVTAFKSYSKDFDSAAFDRALKRLVDMVPAGSIGLDSVVEVLTKERSKGQEHDIDAPGLDGTRHSGLPWMVMPFKPNKTQSPKNYERTKAAFQDIVAQSERDKDLLSQGKPVDFVGIVGQRLVNKGPDQLASDKAKRLIIAIGKNEPVCWKLFTPQLQASLKRVKSASGAHVFMAWYDAPQIDHDIQKHLRWAKERGLPSLSGDISGFDASVVPDMWQRIADACSVWFQNPAFFKALNYSVINRVTIVSPLGLHKPVASSIKSGSGGTNLMDCLINLATLFYGEEIGLYKAESYAVQGDDFFVSGEGVDPEQVAIAYSHLNLTVHPDKQTFAQDRLNYLQRMHVLGWAGGIASLYRVVGSLLVYERLTVQPDKWNPYLETIMSISKLENLAFHPGFEEAIKLVQQWDRYKYFADLQPAQIIKRAGNLAGDELARDSAASISTRTAAGTAEGFDRSPVNGVLRGERMPPVGSKERFIRVYGNQRVSQIID